MRGATAPEAEETTLARGFIPNSFAFSADIKMIAAPPSFKSGSVAGSYGTAIFLKRVSV
jgi:hypothetical protein